MPDEIKVNRVNSQPVQPRSETGTLTQDFSASSRPSKLPWIVLGLIVVILLVVGVAFRDKLFGSSSKDKAAGSKTAQEQPYQAVFLTNGQVYFGKLSNTNSDFATLKDIWYLQVVQPQQPIQGQQPGEQQQTQPQISLIKLGQELHGPVDEMHISKTQILFYEDLKADGQVVKTITDEKAKQK